MSQAAPKVSFAEDTHADTSPAPAGGGPANTEPGTAEQHEARTSTSGLDAPASSKKTPGGVIILPKRVLLPKYIPFDVQDWRQGGWAVLGWQLCAWLAFISAGLFALYELIYINRFDRDCRDLYMDNRLLQESTNYYHKYFLNAETCCNTDPVVFNYTCDATIAPSYSPDAPYCPPIIIMQCAGLTSAPCNATRAALYQAAGLTASGQYFDCQIAGQVLVGAEDPVSTGPLVLIAKYNGVRFGTPFAIPQPFNINQTELRAYVQGVANTYPDPNRVQPNNPLSRSFRIPGIVVNLTMPGPVVWRNALKLINPWTLWPWPGFNARCLNTYINEQYYLYGSNPMSLPPYNYSNSAAMVIDMQFMNQTIRVPMYQLTQLASGQVAGASDLNQVSLSIVSIIQVLVGQVPPLGSCYGWTASQAALNVTYRPLRNTTMDYLLTNTVTPPARLNVMLFVYDMAGPQFIALPEYEGIWLLVFGIGLGGFWVFAMSFFILIPLPLIWWNVRNNQGLPPIVYRYMQRYRGW